MGYQFIRQLKCVFGLLKYIYASFGTLNGDACKSHNSRVLRKKNFFILFINIISLREKREVERSGAGKNKFRYWIESEVGGELLPFCIAIVA